MSSVAAYINVIPQRHYVGTRRKSGRPRKDRRNPTTVKLAALRGSLALNGNLSPQGWEVLNKFEPPPKRNTHEGHDIRPWGLVSRCWTCWEVIYDTPT